MSLTQIQTDAIARARRGDYSLLDAMELAHRLEEGGAAYGHLIGGRLRLLAYGDPHENTCDDCLGAGERDCVADGCDDGDIDCSACVGTPDHTIAHAACGGEGCDDPACIDGQVECDTCGGTGLLTCRECHGDGVVECSTCGGDGDLPPEHFTNLRVENLDGRVLWRETADQPDDPWEWVGRKGLAWARQILDDYHQEPRAEAATSAHPAGQTALELETA